MRIAEHGDADRPPGVHGQQHVTDRARPPVAQVTPLGERRVITRAAARDADFVGRILRLRWWLRCGHVVRDVKDGGRVQAGQNFRAMRGHEGAQLQGGNDTPEVVRDRAGRDGIKMRLELIDDDQALRVAQGERDLKATALTGGQLPGAQAPQAAVRQPHARERAQHAGSGQIGAEQFQHRPPELCLRQGAHVRSPGQRRQCQRLAGTAGARDSVDCAGWGQGQVCGCRLRET